jgi:hypothetical protein
MQMYSILGIHSIHPRFHPSFHPPVCDTIKCATNTRRPSDPADAAGSRESYKSRVYVYTEEDGGDLMRGQVERSKTTNNMMDNV